MYAEPQGLPDPDYQPEFYAGVPLKRLLAWLLDTGLILVLCLLILPFTAFTGLFFFPALMLVVGFVYRWATLTLGSATWGMRLFAIDLRQADGARLDGAGAFWHTLGYSLSMALPVLQLLSIALMLTSSRGQGLSDHMLGTVAINRPA
ncbi:RDD family protein [Pseudooceanicola sp.]|uniref:RDD family protein n=1 Tax=Pseudooceanicola sp. TaxID=1914328 RepID=UPI0026370890|nr:RDD family protein [Pseudooceanicola sp.]MDF1854916.1 RDD family protein [Pseudooceanicola sp.]